MSALPLRWRVTGAFCAAFVLVMSVVGALVLTWFGRALAESDDRALRVRVDALAAAQAASPTVLPLGGSVVGFDESPTQVLDAQGRPLASSAGLQVPLLTVDQARAAGSGPRFTDRPGDARLDESLRLLARPVTLPDGRQLVVVAATSRDENEERVQSLLVIGSAGLLVALVLCGAAGYVVAGIALKPVETMRRDAEAVNAAGHGRLTTTSAGDEISRLGDTLNAMLHRIQRAREVERSSLHREQRFVTDASHELRGPLTTLRSEIELALADPRPSAARLREALVSAGEETSRLCTLTDDLLTLARTHEVGSRPRHVDLATLVAEVVDEHRDAARDAGRGITLRCSLPGGARVDPALVRSAVGNLVGNAVRHGGGLVECRAWRSADVVQIEVRDHGPGFDPLFLPDAVQRFSRADTARSGPGTGLGLAIVDAVARAHGGRLLIDGDGGGARVVLQLSDPVEPAPDGSGRALSS